MSKYHDDNTSASHPGQVELSVPRLRRTWRGYYWLFFALRPVLRVNLVAKLAEHVQLGDSRAAVVVRRHPLTVAAYTDELDCVALLEFPAHLAGTHGLETGSRLLTVNTYAVDGDLAKDLWNGPESYGRYVNFHPVIVDFVSDSTERIESRKGEIDEAEWERCRDMGFKRLQERPDGHRNGCPMISGIPPD